MSPINNQKSRLIATTLMGGEARVLLCDTTAMAREAREVHHASRTCAAALGRTLTAAAMMGARLEGDENITLSIRGNGPAGAIIAVARHGVVKITIDAPEVELPLRADGKLDVGGAVGSEGRLSLVRDLGFGEPYVGQVKLVSGEIAEDVAMYYTASEQVPSLCALGVLVREGATEAEDWRVAASGGLLIQAMPGCSESLLDALELRSQLFGTLSAELEARTLEDILAESFRGLAPEIVEEVPLALTCDCSAQRIERALITLGEGELTKIIDEQHGCEVQCHFCHKRYQFDEQGLTALRDAAVARGKENTQEVTQ